jgi:hypothetical protein
MRGKTEFIRRKPCPNTTLSTTNPICITLGSNRRLLNERATTKLLLHVLTSVCTPVTQSGVKAVFVLTMALCRLTFWRNVPSVLSTLRLEVASFNVYQDGFCALVVSMLASGTRVPAVGFFPCGKNPQACLPSEGK